MKPYKRYYIVKKQVLAESLVKAAYAKGRIYEVIEVEDRYQPEPPVKTNLGFKKKRK